MKYLDTNNMLEEAAGDHHRFTEIMNNPYGQISDRPSLTSQIKTGRSNGGRLTLRSKEPSWRENHLGPFQVSHQLGSKIGSTDEL
jgi:hypothetical protein